MGKIFYQNAIIEDRNSRQFLNFSDETWFSKLKTLSDEEVIKNSCFTDISGEKRNFIPYFFDEKGALECYLGRIFEDSFRELRDFSSYMEKISLSKESLDLLSSIDVNVLKGFLYSCKSFFIGGISDEEDDDDGFEEFNQQRFIRINMPLIRIMDYFLENSHFKQLAATMQRLEEDFISLWLNVTSEKITQIIEKNSYNSDLVYFVSKMDEENFDKHVKKDNLSIIVDSDFEAFYRLIQNEFITEEYISIEYVLSAFKRFKLDDQIAIIETLEERDLSFDLIKRLHKFLNKNFHFKGDEQFISNIFEMSSKKFRRLTEVIEKSSYFSKNDIRNSALWKFLISKDENNIDFEHDYYSDIMDLYHECREYATSSIVNSLYPLNKLSDKVTHIRNEPFNILARVRTGMLFEGKTLEETFTKRTFCSFSILNQRNVSHYGDAVLYGYYTNVSKNSIAHIYPIDSLSSAGARYESELTDRINMLLDIEDLNAATLEQNTYNQLCIKTKDENGNILWPDCIICIDKIDEKSQKIADSLGLNIVVLHKNEDTIECNEDIYKNLQ